MCSGLDLANYAPKLKKFFGKTDFPLTGQGRETMKYGERNLLANKFLSTEKILSRHIANEILKQAGLKALPAHSNNFTAKNRRMLCYQRLRKLLAAEAESFNPDGAHGRKICRVG